MEDIVPCFNEDGLGAVVSSSRGIIYKHLEMEDYDGTRDSYLRMVREQAENMQVEVYGALKQAYKDMCY